MIQFVTPIALVATLLAAPGAHAAEEAACAVEYDAGRQALVLRYDGTDLDIDTQDDAAGIRVVVRFSGPVALRAGRSLSAIAPFATWRFGGERQVFVFKRPDAHSVEGARPARTAWLIN